MRIRTVFTTFTFAALTVGALTVWTNISGVGQSDGVPGSWARFTQDTRFGPDATAAGPQPTLGMAGQPAPPLLSPGRVNVSVQGFYSWALLDRKTGNISGSANFANATNSTESMIKVWIAADYLRRLSDEKPSQDRLGELTRMIRDSDNSAAEDIYQIDGADSVVQRMISICGLSETSASEGWWSRTEVSARDSVRLGVCVTDGRAAGPKWTSWILGEMRQVRGEGRFGIIDALPDNVAARIPIKNGWTVIGDEWHVNCLAVVDRYVLAVLTRYPESLGLSYGADICRSVTAQLRPRS
ncbi:MAG: hypothetical protein JWP76_2574 [Dactylosporangium sp.]|nr:hypothetical protein [Dactylosporangium sp.]